LNMALKNSVRIKVGAVEKAVNAVAGAITGAFGTSGRQEMHASNDMAFADMEARRAIAADRLCSERLIDTARCNIQHRVN